MTQSFTYDGPRIGRTVIYLMVLIACPLLISQFSDHGDLIFVLFGSISAVWLSAVVLVAWRFRLDLKESELTCRGRFTQRTIKYSDIKSIRLRKGPDRAGRLSLSTPLNELVIRTDARTVVLSSIPLGTTGFEAVVKLLKARTDVAVWS